MSEQYVLYGQDVVRVSGIGVAAEASFSTVDSAGTVNGVFDGSADEKAFLYNSAFKLHVIENAGIDVLKQTIRDARAAVDDYFRAEVSLEAIETFSSYLIGFPRTVSSAVISIVDIYDRAEDLNNREVRGAIASRFVEQADGILSRIDSLDLYLTTTGNPGAHTPADIDVLYDATGDLLKVSVISTSFAVEFTSLTWFQQMANSLVGVVNSLIGSGVSSALDVEAARPLLQNVWDVIDLARTDLFPMGSLQEPFEEARGSVASFVVLPDISFAPELFAGDTGSGDTGSGDTGVTFSGTAGDDIADVFNQSLGGFSGGDVSDLLDGFGDTFYGAGGNDQIYAGQGDDVIYGGAGNDRIQGYIGNDIIDPGSNESHDTIISYSGIDTIIYSNTSGNFQQVDYFYAPEGITANLNAVANSATVDKGSFGVDSFVDFRLPVEGTAASVYSGFRIWGSVYSDTFNVTTLDDGFIGIVGGDGVDTYNLMAGYVRLSFYIGAEAANVDLGRGLVINDGFGNTEVINGTVGELRLTYLDDQAVGSAGNDHFIAGAGDDVIDGGAGFDRIRYNREEEEAVDVSLALGTATYVIRGETYTDTLSSIEWVRASNGSDRVVGSSTSNTLEGLDGDDIVDGGLGDDRINGGSGVDEVRFDAATSGVDVYLNAGFARGGSGRDAISNVENATGTRFDDRLVGDAGDNVLAGGAGDDVLKSKGGNDTLLGGAGNDKLRGDAGDETLDGGDGSDLLFGLGGTDVLLGGAGNDFLYGGRDGDTAHGQAGDDLVRGNLGSDLLTGGGGVDRIYGGGSNDTLQGDGGNDYLVGENGADRIEGGTGEDSLTGGLFGAGGDGARDTFVFAPGSGFDRVLDFEVGTDRLDVSDYGLTYAQIEAATQDAGANGANARIDLTNGDTIYLLGVDANALSENDFIV